MSRYSTDVMQPPGLTVSIDFGTSFSGVCVKAPLDPDPALFREFPARDVFPPYPKMPSKILYKITPHEDGSSPPCYQYVAIGHEAEALFRGMSGAQQRRHALLGRFKLQLARDAAHVAPLPPGLGAERVITDFLRELHRLALAWLPRCAYGTLWDPATATYVLTVPANWSDEAKATMRRCAHNAGITASEGSLQLQLVHEPEAASIALVKQYHPSLQLQPGDTVLVCDLGGGTADFTLHALRPARGAGAPDRMDELACRRAELAGATFVDDRFEKWFAEELGVDEVDETPFLESSADSDSLAALTSNLAAASLGGPSGGGAAAAAGRGAGAAGEPPRSRYAAWKAAKPREHMELMRRWEEYKRTFAGGEGASCLSIDLPTSLWTLLGDEKKGELYAAVDEDADEEEAMALRLPAEVMESRLLKPVVDQVMDAVRPMTEGRHVDYVFAAGGFSASPYVAKRLQAELGAAARANSKVLCARDPGAAVLLGACIYGEDPHIIASRMSALAYGVRVAQRFRPGMPADERFLCPYTLTPQCRVCFCRFVAKGQPVAADEVVEHEFCTAAPFQSSARFDVFCTADNGEELTTAPGMRRVAQMQLELPEPRSAAPRHLRASFKFGTAEIQVTAVDVKSGKEVDTIIQFLSE